MTIPQVCKTSADNVTAQRRLLICSEPGEGKTYTSIMTSPNPIVIDIDKGITDPRLVAMKVPTFPVWDDEWRNNILKKAVKCNAVIEIIKSHVTQLTIEQTLIIDSLSSLQDDVAEYLWKIAPQNKEGQRDPFGFWETVKDWWIAFFGSLSSLQCHVILTAHLADLKHKDNPALTIGYRPLIDGSIKAQIGRFFTDVIRQHATEKKSGDVITTEYKWQVKSDSMFKAKSRIECNGLYIPADFKKMINYTTTATV